MDTLLIRLRSLASPEPVDIQADWLVVDGNRLPLDEGGPGPLSEVTPLAAQRRVVVLLPAEEVLLTRVELKIRNRQQLTKAIPYALEEELADDVDHLHFAVSSSADEAGGHAVAVVSRRRMDGLLEALHGAGLSPAFATSEVLCLPFDAGEWSLLLEDQRAVIRTGGLSGFACEAENLAVLLNHALVEQENPPQRLRTYRCTEASIQLPPLGPAIEQHEEELCPPRLFALGLDEKDDTINLLQGPYQLESPMMRRLRPWRIAAALLAAWVALQTGIGTWDYLRLRDQESALRHEIEALYRSTFPEAKRIVNPRIQMEQRLRELAADRDREGNADLLNFLGASAQAFKDASGVRVDDIVYREGHLEIALTATDLQSVEGIKEQIRNEGYEATIQSADTRESRVNARLLIRRLRT